MEILPICLMPLGQVILPMSRITARLEMRDKSQMEMNMTSIESLSGSDSNNLTSLIQQLSKQRQVAQSGSSTVDGRSDASTVIDGNDQGINAMKEKIDAAILEALQKLDKSASADEIMQTIKSAVDTTLKANGIDPEAMKSKMRPPMAPSDSGQNAAAMPPPKGGPEGGDDFMSKVIELLRDNGFDVDKFKSELASEMAKRSDSSTLDFMSNMNSSVGLNEQA